MGIDPIRKNFILGMRKRKKAVKANVKSVPSK
jgi:hypothetical protein